MKFDNHWIQRSILFGFLSGISLAGNFAFGIGFFICWVGMEIWIFTEITGANRNETP